MDSTFLRTAGASEKRTDTSPTTTAVAPMPLTRSIKSPASLRLQPAAAVPLVQSLLNFGLFSGIAFLHGENVKRYGWWL